VRGDEIAFGDHAMERHVGDVLAARQQFGERATRK
jgi:hypothetical protein